MFVIRRIKSKNDGSTTCSANFPSHRILVVVLFALAFSLVSCSSDDNDSMSSDSSEISWSMCIDNPLLDCATLEVPLDYDVPNGETINIALTRKAASGGERQGVLLLNPGGPGGSGTELMYQIEGLAIPSRITEAYDLVGFDPRGVAMSGGIECGIDEEDAFSEYPQTFTEITQMQLTRQLFADDCVTTYGKFLQQLGSNNVVRDMDRIRIGLGEEKLDFLGYSYGTRLGSLYLELFPDTTGKLILDASLPPSGDITELTHGQLEQMQVHLSNWLAQCVSVDPSCDVDALESRLSIQLGKLLGEMQSNDESVANTAAVEFELLGTVALLSVDQPESGEFTLPAILSYLENDDVRGMEEVVRIIESFVIEPSSQSMIFNEVAALRAVACADDALRMNDNEVVALLEGYNQVSDVFAENNLIFATQCTGWPSALEPVQAVTTQSNGRVVVIGGVSDASNPLRWSEAMAATINSPLIISEHTGHTIVFHGRNSCVDNQVTSFLLDDKQPQVFQCPVDED